MQLYANQPCKKCGKKTIKKIAQFELDKLIKSYFYTATIFCPNCKTIYLNDIYKITKDQVLKTICHPNNTP
jgi:hypothetical protein